MNADIQYLTNLFYPTWSPPPESGVRSHRIQSHEVKPKHVPVNARAKIMAALDTCNWMSIEDLAKATSLVVPTVAITTDRMYKARTIERLQKKTAYGKVNLFRKK